MMSNSYVRAIFKFEDLNIYDKTWWAISFQVYFIWVISIIHKEPYLKLRIVTIVPALQLKLTKFFAYIIYLYIFITVKTAPQLNRLSRTAQTAVTIRNLKCNKLFLRLAIFNGFTKILIPFLKKSIF